MADPTCPTCKQRLPTRCEERGHAAKQLTRARRGVDYEGHATSIPAGAWYCVQCGWCPGYGRVQTAARAKRVSRETRAS